MANSGNIYIYSTADLGLPANIFLPGGTGFSVGATYVTSGSPTPDILSITDDDSLLDGITYDPVYGNQVYDTNQQLTSDLVVDGATVAAAGDIVFPYSAEIVMTTTTGQVFSGYYLATAPDQYSSITLVGFVTTISIPPNTTYEFTGVGSGFGPLYSSLAPCFTRDTMIECKNGPVAVQDIVEGDLVVTRNNGLQAVRWAGSRTVVGAGEMAPIRVKAGALGNAVDMRFSPMHRMLISGPRAELLFGAPEMLAHAAHLCDGDQIFREPCAEVTYYHILFDRHEIIRAHGCWSESFAPTEAALGAVDAQARAELLKLFPQLDQDWRDALPTLSAAEAQLAI